MNKIDVDGRVMWESNNGERVCNPDTEPNRYGATKIEVDGQIMWENNNGERFR